MLGEGMDCRPPNRRGPSFSAEYGLRMLSSVPAAVAHRTLVQPEPPPLVSAHPRLTRSIGRYRCVSLHGPSSRPARRSDRPYVPRARSTAQRRRSGLRSFPGLRPVALASDPTNETTCYVRHETIAVHFGEPAPGLGFLGIRSLVRAAGSPRRCEAVAGRERCGISRALA